MFLPLNNFSLALRSHSESCGHRFIRTFPVGGENESQDFIKISLTNSGIEIPRTRPLFGLKENQVELVPLLAEDDLVVLQPGHHVPQRHLPLLVQLRDLVVEDHLATADNIKYLPPVEVVGYRLQLLLSLTSQLTTSEYKVDNVGLRTLKLKW